ncbi:thioesterase family protein [Conexibacter sp. JD483]|uniref:thioesterase family protein n=1 Tax=unclassified Conexibacter TaxID=2627773 RepID=UPI00271CEB42|nr:MULTISPECIES: thioesterase family protein [unclassified Conexibacter]MDO8185124.1 thioesterase family protein [Conexibacter sp. CPCC 205706]MDO8196834.1 thioesterase family protein [Conexibacter sp. CPCC 205762]MDR9368610.1 thioesterase family protein [Conexibacter sp. JD483]
MSDGDAIFQPDGPDRFRPTELARGPWDPTAQHGGAPAGLLAGALEAFHSDVPMAVLRLTCEFIRPVPLTPLRVETRIVRPGGRVQLVEAQLHAGETVVCRALALRVRRADVPAPDEVDPAPDVPGPDDSAAVRMELFDTGPTMFARDGMEVRMARGAFDEVGPAVAWFRLRVPLVAGERPTPLQRLAAAADFGNGISSAVPWATHLFINPDLTIYVERLPEGEWVGLDARTRVGRSGAGLAESVLFDGRGRLGRSLQGLYVAER